MTPTVLTATVTLDERGAVVRDLRGTELSRIAPDAVVSQLGVTLRRLFGRVVVRGRGLHSLAVLTVAPAECVEVGL